MGCERAKVESDAARRVRGTTRDLARGVLIWAVCVGTATGARRRPPNGAQHLLRLRLLHAADTSLASEA
jgi:hypothetical protein